MHVMSKKSIFVVSIDFESFIILPVTNKQKQQISILCFIYLLKFAVY